LFIIRVVAQVLMMNKARKPNLFIIGHPKSGTSALFEFLKQHPDIFAPEMKETNHFSKEFVRERFSDERLIRRFALTDEEYVQLYSKVENEKYLIDATPHYLFSKNAAKRICKYNPKAKIIAIFREPVNFLRSWHSELVFSFLEDEKDFITALDKEQVKKSKGSHSFLHYSEWIKYTEQLIRYTEVFNSRNIKVIIFEQFKKDNEKIFKELVEFLNVNKDAKINFFIYNQNRELRMGFVKKLGETPIIWSNTKKLLPKTIFVFLKKIYILLIQKNVSRKILPQGNTLDLKKRFYKEVKLFDEVLKRENLIREDLSVENLWGYKGMNDLD